MLFKWKSFFFFSDEDTLPYLIAREEKEEGSVGGKMKWEWGGWLEKI